MTASEAIAEALDQPTATADDILAALGQAGYILVRPDGRTAAWIPASARGERLVKVVASLTSKGLDKRQIAAELRRSIRSVERYTAAGVELGLIPVTTGEA